jgi:hypothetical protein
MRAQRSRFVLGLTMAVATILAGIPSRAAAQGDAKLRIARDDSTASIYDGQRLVLHYRYADVAKKPYVDQLFSPAGVEVLRDSPPDHKHHHGLMYALEVDKVNFWEEDRQKSGQEEQKSLAELKPEVRHGVGRAGLVEQLDWLDPASEKPLLVERRTIEVLAAKDLVATLVQWCCRLQPPSGKDKMVLRGNFYFGLGMRFPASMEGGRFFNADDKTAELVRGKGPFVQTKWCAYTAKADDKPVTVAIFDHPANRPAATIYTKTEPFHYLSATLNEWQKPVTVKAGKPLDLCYGIAVWDGEVDKQTVEKLYERWLELAK